MCKKLIVQKSAGNIRYLCLGWCGSRVKGHLAR